MRQARASTGEGPDEEETRMRLLSMTLEKEAKRTHAHLRDFSKVLDGQPPEEYDAYNPTESNLEALRKAHLAREDLANVERMGREVLAHAEDLRQARTGGAGAGEGPSEEETQLRVRSMSLSRIADRLRSEMGAMANPLGGGHRPAEESGVDK